MVFAISKRACVRNLQMMLVLGLMWLVSLGAAAQSLPTIKVCNDCSTDWQFSQAAISASNANPNQSDVVYVVKLTTEQTRVYSVSIFMYTGPFGEIDFHYSVTEISGDPAVLGDIAAATTIFKDFNDALIQDFDAEELDLSFDSAIDLIGDENSAAGGFRRELQEKLTDYYSGFWRSMITDATDTIDSLLDKFLAESGLDAEYDIVVFEDGTKVRLKIEEVGRVASDPFTIIIEFDVDVDSVTAPGTNFVPVTPGQFEGFSGSGLDNDLSEQLRDLALLFGVTILGSNEPNCSTTWHCDKDRCTLTLIC